MINEWFLNKLTLNWIVNIINMINVWFLTKFKWRSLAKLNNNKHRNELKRTSVNADMVYKHIHFRYEIIKELQENILNTLVNIITIILTFLNEMGLILDIRLLVYCNHSSSYKILPSIYTYGWPNFATKSLFTCNTTATFINIIIISLLLRSINAFNSININLKWLS